MKRLQFIKSLFGVTITSIFPAPDLPRGCNPEDGRARTKKALQGSISARRSLGAIRSRRPAPARGRRSDQQRSKTAFNLCP